MSKPPFNPQIFEKMMQADRGIGSNRQGIELFIENASKGLLTVKGMPKMQINSQAYLKIPISCKSNTREIKAFINKTSPVKFDPSFMKRSEFSAVEIPDPFVKPTKKSMKNEFYNLATTRSVLSKKSMLSRKPGKLSLYNFEARKPQSANIHKATNISKNTTKESILLNSRKDLINIINNIVDLIRNENIKNKQDLILSTNSNETIDFINFIMPDKLPLFQLPFINQEFIEEKLLKFEFEKIRDYFISLLAKNPTNVYILHNLAACYNLISDWDKCVEMCEKGIQKPSNTNKSGNWLMLGELNENFFQLRSTANFYKGNLLDVMRDYEQYKTNISLKKATVCMTFMSHDNPNPLLSKPPVALIEVPEYSFDKSKIPDLNQKIHMSPTLEEKRPQTTEIRIRKFYTNSSRSHRFFNNLLMQTSGSFDNYRIQSAYPITKENTFNTANSSQLRRVKDDKIISIKIAKVATFDNPPKSASKTSRKKLNPPPLKLPSAREFMGKTMRTTSKRKKSDPTDATPEKTVENLTEFARTVDNELGYLEQGEKIGSIDPTKKIEAEEKKKKQIIDKTYKKIEQIKERANKIAEEITEFFDEFTMPESGSESPKRNQFPQSDDLETLKNEFVKEVPNLGILCCLGKLLPFMKPFDDDARKSMLGAAKAVVCEANNTIFKQGDSGDAMYIILDGEIKLWLNDNVLGKQPFLLATLREPGHFGEMALIQSDEYGFSGRKRGASAVCTKKSTLISIPGDEVKKAVRGLFNGKFKQDAQILRRSIYFYGMDNAELFPILCNIQRVKFTYGEYIIKENTEIDGLYFIATGQCLYGVDTIILDEKKTRKVLPKSECSPYEIEKGIPHLIVAGKIANQESFGGKAILPPKVIIENGQAKVIGEARKAVFSVVADSVDVEVIIINKRIVDKMPKAKAETLYRKIRENPDPINPENEQGSAIRKNFIEWERYKVALSDDKSGYTRKLHQKQKFR